MAALDVDTGEPVWTFDSKAKSPMWQRCRSVAYYKMPTINSDPILSSNRLCQERIIMTTIDARLIEIDAKNRKLCDDFGDQGEVKPGFYFQT